MNQGDEEGYITYRSRRQRGAENIFNQEEIVEENQPEAEQEEVAMGDQNEDRALQILEGIQNGQQQLAQLLAQLIATNQENQNHGGNNGNGGTNGHHGGNNGAGGPNGNNGNHAEGNNNHIPAQVGTRTTWEESFPGLFYLSSLGINKQGIKDNKVRVRPLMIIGGSTRLWVRIFRRPCHYRTTAISSIGTGQGRSTGVNRTLIS
jgi:hypothetical protein